MAVPEYGHFTFGVVVVFVSFYLSYRACWDYLKSCYEGSKYVSTIHYYSQRCPRLSYIAVIKLMVGTGALIAYMIIKRDDSYLPYYKNGEYQMCCRYLDHFVYSSSVFLSGVADILMAFVNIRWPKGMDKFVSALMMLIIGFIFLEHSLMKSHPLELVVHIILALLLFSLAEEIQRLYAESKHNQAFVLSTFIAHIIGAVTLMFLFYMTLALRWRAQFRMGVADTSMTSTNGYDDKRVPLIHEQV